MRAIVLEQYGGPEVLVVRDIPDPVPGPEEVLVAAKHQSFLDILILFRALPRAKFIMKKELRWAPILGLYALRIGSTPNAGSSSA